MEGLGESKLLKKIVSGTVLTLLLIGMSTLAFNIQPAGTKNELRTAEDGLQYNADQNKAHDQPMSVNINVANIADEWLMFMHDERNTGHSLDTLIYPPLQQVWEFDAKYYIAAPPIASHDAVYAVRQNGVVYKLNAVDGSRIWEKDVGYYVDSSPALGPDLVFVSLLNGTLDALNKNTGEIAWMFNTEGWTTSAATYTDGIVYVGSSRNVYAINASNGVEKWRFATDGWVEAPAVSNGIVYVGSADGRLYAINADSGTEKWRFPAIGDLGTIVNAPIVGDGIVYMDADKLYALNASNGQQLWDVPVASAGDLAGFAYNTVLCSDWYGDQIRAFDATTGILKWNYSFSTPEYPYITYFAGRCITANNMVYACFASQYYRSTLVVLDAFNGTPVWQHNATDFLDPIIANGRLYMSEGNRTLCFAPSAVSDGFDYPVGIPPSQGGTGYVTEANDGDGYYNAQDFGEWNGDYGGYHLGEDWNGEGGGDTDFGDPVYAVSNGKVVYARDAGAGWGNVIIINHTVPDGSTVQSMYAHLRYGSLLVSEGNIVLRGTKIGEIGKGYNDNEYWAHLHFEMRFPTCPSWGRPGSGYSLDLTGRTDPSNFIDTHRQLYAFYIKGRAFNIGVWSNSSVSNVQLDSDTKTISFNIEGASGTAGFCNVTIPKELLWCDGSEDWTVIIGTTPVSPLVTQDEENTYVYFTYTHSQKTVYITGTHIIPEFQANIILPLFLTLTLLVVVVAKKKNLKKTEDKALKLLFFLIFLSQNTKYSI